MASKSLAFQIIENNELDNLRDTLEDLLAKATEVCISVAFVTQSGLDEIIYSLQQVTAEGRKEKVRLLTGLYQRVTEPKALDALLGLQTQTKGRFSVRLSTEPKFHRKVYLVENDTQATAIIGSSNLTKEGLQSGGMAFSKSLDRGDFSVPASLLPGSVGQPTCLRACCGGRPSRSADPGDLEKAIRAAAS